MQQHTRRAVAFVAGKLIRRDDGQVVYDPQLGKSVKFAGKVTRDRVYLRDAETGAYVTGGRGARGVYTLFVHANDAHLDLRIDGSHFKGYDCDSGATYSGSVEGRNVTVRDGSSASGITFRL